jgi:hypothetical protein
VNGFVICGLPLAALLGADDIGEPEGLGALGGEVAVVAAVQVKGLDIKSVLHPGIVNDKTDEQNCGPDRSPATSCRMITESTVTDP